MRIIPVLNANNRHAHFYLAVIRLEQVVKVCFVLDGLTRRGTIRSMVAVPPGFRGYDPCKPVDVYHRNLPHWRQEGASYTVTFRLEDALPSAVREEVREEIQRFKRCKENGVDVTVGTPSWLRYQKRVGKRVNDVLDQGIGEAILRQTDIALLVADIMGRREGEDYHLFAYVVMPNHCHAIVAPMADKSLEAIIQAWKSISAREINRRLNRRGRVWQAEYYDRIVRDETEYRRAVEYILQNPSKAGLGDGKTPVWHWRGGEGAAD